MNRFVLPDKTLHLLAAQVNLNGMFNHTCRSQNTNQPLTFQLQVERSPGETLLIVVMNNERHSLTVYDNDRYTHLVLADFIECSVNSHMDTAEPAVPRIGAESVERGRLLDDQQLQQLSQLIRNGGALLLDVGLDDPVSLAVHRTRNRTGITAILATGETYALTSCFTAYGHDQHSFDRLLQSLNHLVASATAAKHVA
ncbi:hypothetical protein [Pseudomonas helleri]|uniref:hypothetical protein n=1 Tax=Pseudomonas helleri TaxID=1608996 RepID=UPI00242FAB20|nr:hypothetical protein [Pseudomonas helleri]